MSFVPLDCTEVRDLLAELALGALTHDEAHRVERHVETCPGCRKELAERRTVATVHRETERQLQQQTRDLNRTIRQLGRPPAVATLAPTNGYQGTGDATIVSLRGRDDQILVIISLVPRSNAPYSVRLQTRSGKVFNAGTLVPTTKGTLVLYDNQSTDDLSRVQFVSILDRDAHPVMTGTARLFVGPPGA